MGKLRVGDGSLLSCRNHPELVASLRCDECRQLYCRECVVERWVTSRSSVWVCRRCTGGWRPTGEAGRSSPIGLGRYTPLALLAGGAALVVAAATIIR